MSRGKWTMLVAFVVVLVCFAGTCAVAETIVETWQSASGEFNGPQSISVNPIDGSCWVGDSGTWNGTGFVNGAVIHLSAAGAELWRSASGAYPYGPASVSVNPTDGSCWVADADDIAVVHLAKDGTQLLRPGGFLHPISVSVNSADGSCWVADGDVVHLSETGVELWRGAFFTPVGISVNPTDGSCWVADQGDWIGAWGQDFVNSAVVHLSATGAQLWRGIGSFTYVVLQVSVNSTDGSCWVIEQNDNIPLVENPNVMYLVHLAQDGTELWRSAGYSDVSVNPADGSCWAVSDANELVHLAADGTELWRGVGTFADAISVNPADGSCWAAGHGQLVHLVVRVDFSDTPYYYWAFHQIEAAYAAGIVKGYSDGTYKPTDTVTRDQMAVYISRALAGGDDQVPAFTGAPSFSDVGVDNWALKYVEYAVDNNVVKGYSDGTYKPTDQVDRGQMSVFIARAIATPTDGADLVYYTPPATATFPDVATSFWAYKYVEYIAQPTIGVTKGYPDGDYHPEYVCTRDQMAVYIQRAFKLPM